jgi:serine/threonine protein kinase/Tol biopolymer transport system component
VPREAAEVPDKKDHQTTAELRAAEWPLLQPGMRLGRYEVVTLLGRGGMGRVYRARDATLGRDVAIKALAHSFEEDSSNLRRFEREARVLAALSHPGIAAIYGFETIDGAPYLVLELIEGETLLDRLEEGALPFSQAIAVATSVAEALEEAHRQGIVHRDLKPSNVMLMPEGRVKVLDFGLAKRVPRPTDDEPAPASQVTKTSGTVMGTAPYMSPEQVRGDEVDTRSDVWAFGCLLYEMLSGRTAFRGRSAADILASVLRDDVEWRVLPPETPPSVRRLLRRCLRRDRQARLQSIGDARVELEDLKLEEEESSAPTARARPSASRWLPWLVSGVCAAAAAGSLLASRRTRPPEDVRLSLELPSAVALLDDFTSPFAIAPDGSRIAIVGVEGGIRRLYLRSLDDLSVHVLAGTEGARQPFFSPDGRWVGFFSERWLKKAPVGGGPPVAIAEVGGNPRGAVWTPGGTIVFTPSQTSGLQRIPETGGPPADLTTLDTARQDASHRWPDLLPGGKWVLYTAAAEDASYDEARLEVVSLETGERRTLMSNAAYGRHLPEGRLAFVRSGRLQTVGLASGPPATSGEPQVLVDGIRYDPRNGAAHLAVAPSGTFVYAPAPALSPERYLAWLDDKGRLSRLVDTPRLFSHLRLSGDGSRVALRIGGLAASDLWSFDLASSTLSRLTTGLSPHRPAWRPDGRGVTVSAEQGGRWRLLTLPVGTPGPSHVLLEGPDRMYPNDWTSDGRALVFQVRSAGGGWDLMLLEPDARPQPLVATPFQETSGVVSPDGAWLAYESDELDGIVQVYVRPFSQGGEPIRASTAGARRPRWGPDGRLYYWSTTVRQFEAVRVQQQQGRLAVAKAVPAVDPAAAAAIRREVVMSTIDGFEIDRSGRLLVLQAAGDTSPPPLGGPIVVLRPRR